MSELDWSKGSVRERLLELFFGTEHPNPCKEPEPHFKDEDTDRPGRDGCLTIKCWNCDFQDHFLYRQGDA